MASADLFQYLLTEFANEALQKFAKTANATSQPEKVFEAIRHIRGNTLLPKALEVSQLLETTHLHSLLELPAYREFVDEDRALMWKYIDQFNDALAAQVQVTLRVCRKCRTSLLLTPGESGARCPCLQSYQTPNYETFQIWVPTAKLGDYNQQLPGYTG